MTRVLLTTLPLVLALIASAAQANPVASPAQPLNGQTQAVNNPEDTAGTVWDVRPY